MNMLPDLLASRHLVYPSIGCVPSPYSVSSHHACTAKSYNSKQMRGLLHVKLRSPCPVSTISAYMVNILSSSVTNIAVSSPAHRIVPRMEMKCVLRLKSESFVVG